MPQLLDKVWIAPAVMAGSFLIILFIGKRLPEKGRAAIGIVAVTFCFLFSLAVGAQWISRVNHPPTGAEFAAATATCLDGPGGQQHEIEGVDREALLAGETAGHGGEAAGGHSTGEAPASESGGHGGETPATEAPASGGSSEHGAAAVGVAPGESAAVVAPSAATEGGATAEPTTTSEGSGASSSEGHAAASEGEHGGAPPVCAKTTWFQIGETKFEVGTTLDGLSAMMLFVVTLISMLVHWYSTEYLHNDRRHTHYYAFLSLFTASMLFYVLSSNTLQMLVGWELVGLCSFGLIGHWWEEKKNSDAALKAFLTNRVGDMGLIIGVVLLFFAAGATSFGTAHINAWALSPDASHTLLLIGALCLFAGVTSKSGQFPLHTWLPDAMAGPTPVSALIHAATMVVAGVYLIARMYAVFYNGMSMASGGINYVAAIGCFTAFMAAALAFVQWDIKKVLAYSTVSQLGYMVMALGMGAWTAGVFHLFTHALFKAALFLGAGSVSHAAHHTFDMREMGGLGKYMKSTKWTFLLCTFALAGVPFMAGFWSKDEILAGAALGQNGNPFYIMMAVGIITGGMTAAYMTRCYRLTFTGEYRGHGTPHESPKVMTIPLWILTALAFLAVFVNIPEKLLSWAGDSAVETFAVRFEHFVEPIYIFPPVDHPQFTWWVALASLVAAGAGFLIMRQYMVTGFNKGGAQKGVFRGGYVFLEKKYYLDTIYEQGIRDGVKGPIAAAMYWFNMKVLDGIVNGVGIGTARLAPYVYKYFDQGVVDTVVNGSGAVSEESGQLLRRIQTGRVQQYAALLFAGTIFFAGAAIIAARLLTNS